jgi:hypothetical protein
MAEGLRNPPLSKRFANRLLAMLDEWWLPLIFPAGVGATTCSIWCFTSLDGAWKTLGVLPWVGFFLLVRMHCEFWILALLGLGFSITAGPAYKSLRQVILKQRAESMQSVGNNLPVREP